jgi:hypothetical protein
VQVCSVDDRGVDRPSQVVHHDNAGSFTPYVLHGRKDQPLKYCAQIQCARDVAVDPDQKLK